MKIFLHYYAVSLIWRQNPYENRRAMSASPSPRTFSFTTSPLVTSFPSSVRRLTSNSFLFTLSPTDGTSPLVTSSPSSAVTFPPKTLVYTPSPTGPSKQCL